MNPLLPYHLQRETKLCPICRRSFTGHPRRAYCSTRCKTHAKNQRAKQHDLPPNHSRPLTPTVKVTELTPEAQTYLQSLDATPPPRVFTPPTNPTPDQIAYLKRILGDEYQEPTPQEPTQPNE